MKKSITSTSPKIGQKVKIYGVECEITKIRVAGTMDVEEIKGNRAWRVSGLKF